MSGKAHAATFTDIPDKYSSEINYLVDRQIITGYPDG
ncbi:S-layer homology domain-containing protein, partial [Cohnella sp. GbtcB17]